MAMIKCEKCNEAISDKSNVCVHCGEPITKRIECPECKKRTSLDKGACEFCGCPIENKEIIKNKINKVKNSSFIDSLKKNKKVVLILVAVIIVGIIVGVLLSKKNYEDEYEDIYMKLLDTSEEIETIASDLYNSWHYGIYEDYKSKRDLSYDVSLSVDDLDNTYCDLVILDDWNYCVRCIITAHEDLGHFSNIKNTLDDARGRLSAIQKAQSDDSTFQKLNELYLSLSNYYQLAYDYDGSFNSLKTDIVDRRNSVKDNITALDLLLDFNSADYLDSDHGSNKGDEY